MSLCKQGNSADPSSGSTSADRDTLCSAQVASVVSRPLLALTQPACSRPTEWAVQWYPHLPAFTMCTIPGSKGLALDPFCMWLFQKGERSCCALEYDLGCDPDRSLGPREIQVTWASSSLERAYIRSGTFNGVHLYLLAWGILS